MLRLSIRRVRLDLARSGSVSAACVTRGRLVANPHRLRGVSFGPSSNLRRALELLVANSANSRSARSRYVETRRNFNVPISLMSSGTGKTP